MFGMTGAGIKVIVWHHPSIVFAMASTNRFIVHGSHITENLLHHKAADVRRILEEKGFKEDASAASDDATHFHPPAGTPEDGKTTTILFDDGGFVLEDGGVSHSE